MTGSVSELRATAGRVAQWLVEKGRPDDAVALLSAWAVAGPNDNEGQQLLAEALRIDPSARVAQEAFERMERIPGTHAELEGALRQFGKQDLQKLEAEMRRPSFRRAQMGFNNNVKYEDAVFHVQTEDSGLDAPHVITHLFADGGRVIKSHKRTYEKEVARADVAAYVRSLMKAQHMEMVLALREGRFDGVIAGREIGGMTVLSEPPNVDAVRRLASKKQARAEAAPASVAKAPEKPAVPRRSTTGPLRSPSRAAALPKARFRLNVLRSLSGGPERYEPDSDHVVIGSSGAVNLPGEIFCHPREAELSYRQGHLWLSDLEGGNGVFLRIRTPVELEFGDEFLVGDQLLRVTKNPIADDGPDPEPTYFYSSPKWPSSFRVIQVFEGGAPGACVVARGNTLQIGSVIGDLVFADDPLVDQQHCIIEEQAGTVVLTDLGSRTGVFVRIRGEQELVHGDELLIGRTRLVVDLTL
ncbi:MAG TPA: FHA domain-containing protein [Polyangiaceae bacterium]|nr:FHA domain-containing protein [Polyangiaceae bacterium]